MSDEPQPQQPGPSRAPRQPQAADAPQRPAGGGGKDRRTGRRRLIPTRRMVLGTLLVGALLVVGGFVLGYTLVQIPSANALALQQANVYLYADGTVLARDGEVNRENVSLDRISKDAQHAVLAAEDRDFYSESAIDPQAMVRAAWNTATGKGKQSGSTITQQYVKNYYLRQEQTVTRKVKEFFIAIKLDREQTKDQILEGYLNTSYFGRNAYGVQAAAHAYYGIDARDLDAGRAAYLAALVNAPSQYDVVAHPENRPAVEARWNYVLDGMVEEGWLSASERAGMEFPAPRASTLSTGLSGQRGYIVRIVKDHLIENGLVDEASLDAGGYRITTTLHKDKQDAFVDAVNDKLIDRLDQENRKADTYVRAGGASIDTKTGKVVAMYNGIDYVKQYTPNATRRDYQVGSSFKPFVFTAAVDNGSRTQDGRPITPNTVYDGTSERPVEGWSGDRYAPENEDHRDYGDITVREATDKSVNAVYAQMAVDVGPDEVRRTAIDLGLAADTPSLDDAGPSIALGVATASVLDMAQAYATLANHGEHGTYTMIEKITRGGTETVELPARRTHQAVSRQAADTTTHVLRGVVQNGTATAALSAGRPAAGKTGTAEEDRAAWFAGYTPELATVVAVMGQDPVTAAQKELYGVMGLPRINGGGAPAEIWGQYTREALRGEPVQDFDLRLQPGADRPQPSADATGTDPATSDPAGDGETPDGGETQDRTPGTSPGQTDGGTQEQTDGTTATGGTGDGGTDGATTSDGTTDDTTGGDTGGGETGDDDNDDGGGGGLTGALIQGGRERD
ncbi:transglycosylase domain-containing protein [Streptomyces sp. Tu 3180]|uniref:transglycosylase domain-containing protein n=1 Tax=Streptomyces sp. Tu 3180 TaxID=2682611 RepID=UPI00135A7531|nr:transglycosylase domain-containing protein [Streptomyces sp. Tu 3180]KAF3465645.1 penicillin-binding protein [Streptomyces sp. Tu 3180]